MPSAKTFKDAYIVQAQELLLRSWAYDRDSLEYSDLHKQETRARELAFILSEPAELEAA